MVSLGNNLLLVVFKSLFVVLIYEEVLTSLKFSLLGIFALHHVCVVNTLAFFAGKVILTFWLFSRRINFYF